MLAAGRKGTIIVDRFGTKQFNVVRNLAQSLTADDAPRGLRSKRILKINLGQILSDSNNAEEVSANLQNVLKSIEPAKDNVILYVED